LQRVFGYPAFRLHQQDVIEQLLHGGDALVLMPTGGGKSLCFQIPAMLRQGTAVVVSPLIALMQDQVASLRQAGVKAAYLNSSLSMQEAVQVEQQFLQGGLDLLYVAPERLMTSAMLSLLEQAPVALFAIDEAHCVSQWGHDFRPEYLQLSVLGEKFPGVPRVALTATADENTRAEILQRLHLQQAKLFISGFDRPNILYRVVPKHNPRDQLWQFIRTEHRDEAGIVYRLSRKSVDSLAAWLRSKGLKALPYHAGLDRSVRQANQERFLKEDGVIIVATIAFGMGIDKPNVRFVAHLDLPKSIEAYYQETGRAGRDGLPADAWMSYGLQDIIMLRQMMQDSAADESRRRLVQFKLNAMLGFSELTTCRRHALLHYFGESSPQSCERCDNCLQPPVTVDATETARMALSCVYRTGQRFGAQHVMDVLQGKVTERIQRFGHNRLSTYGIGKAWDDIYWKVLFRQLAAQSYLQVDMEGYGALRLAEKCRPLLRGDLTLRIRNPQTLMAKTSGEKPSMGFRDPQDAALWAALKACRSSLAARQNVPPYVIFHDATLVEMVKKRLRSHSDLSDISGVGDYKLNRYGADFLQVIARQK